MYQMYPRALGSQLRDFLTINDLALTRRLHPALTVCVSLMLSVTDDHLALLIVGRAAKRRKVRKSASPDHGSNRSAEIASTPRDDERQDSERSYSHTRSPETG